IPGGPPRELARRPPTTAPVFSFPTQRRAFSRHDPPAGPDGSAPQPIRRLVGKPCNGRGAGAGADLMVEMHKVHARRSPPRVLLFVRGLGMHFTRSPQARGKSRKLSPNSPIPLDAPLAAAL